MQHTQPTTTTAVEDLPRGSNIMRDGQPVHVLDVSRAISSRVTGPVTRWEIAYIDDLDADDPDLHHWIVPAGTRVQTV
jgi:hypothetical protein